MYPVKIRLNFIISSLWYKPDISVKKNVEKKIDSIYH